MKQKPKYYLIVKHNALIEARYKLTLCEQKLVLGVVMQIKPDDKDFQEYRMSVQEFIDLMDVEGNDYHARVEECAREILKKPLTIQLGGGNELYCNWFASIKYEPVAGQVAFDFHPALKPYLLRLQNRYTKYDSANVMRLESKFSIRLYELLKQYLKIGERIITLVEFRLMLGIEDTYSYANIKQRILDPCEIELEDKSDLSYDYQPIKTGRKVTAIRFLIFINEKAAPPQKQLITQEEQKILNQIPVQPTKTLKRAVKRAIKTHGIQGVQEIVTNVTTQTSKGKVKTVGAYATSCLDNGYGVRTQEERDTEQKKKEKLLQLEEQSRQLRLEMEADEKRRKAEADRCQQIDQALAKLTPEQLNELRGEAEQRILDQNNGQKPMGMGMYITFKMREVFLERYEVPEQSKVSPLQMELF